MKEIRTQKISPCKELDISFGAYHRMVGPRLPTMFTLYCAAMSLSNSFVCHQIVYYTRIASRLNIDFEADIIIGKQTTWELDTKLEELRKFYNV